MMDVQNRSTAVNRVLQTRPSDLNSGTLTARESSGYSSLREQAQVEWLESRLTNRAASDPQGFGQTLELALGSRADRATINALVDSSVSGNLPLPNVRFVDSGVLGTGALGAYDPRNGGTVLLDSSLLNDSQALERVYLEEVGHHLDAQFGAGDAAGDEGAIFARSLLGESLTAAQLNELRTEVDHGTVRLDGKLVDVEFHFGSDTPGGSVSGIGGTESNTGGHGGGSYSDNDHDEVKRPKPAPEPTGGYDEVGIDVAAPPEEPAPDRPVENDTDWKPPPAIPSPADAPHGYDEVGIDVPGTRPDIPQGERDDSGVGSVGAGTLGVLSGFALWDALKTLGAAGVSGASAGLLALGSGLIGIFIPRPAGHPSDMIVNNDAKGPRLDPVSDKVVEDAVGETTRENVTSNGTIIDSVTDGDANQANEDFDEMGLNNVKTRSGDRGDVRTGNLPDGSRVTVRPSADGRPTIEVTELNNNGRPIRGGSREIRYGSN